MRSSHLQLVRSVGPNLVATRVSNMAGEAGDGSLESAGPIDAEEARPSGGRVLVVWGPAGAPGRTTVAVGLSSEIAAAGHECLLLDVDAYGGAVAQPPRGRRGSPARRLEGVELAEEQGVFGHTPIIACETCRRPPAQAG